MYLGKSKTTKSLYRSNLVASYKRPKNIRDHLIRAKTVYHDIGTKETQTETPKGDKNVCLKKDCKYCKMLDHSGHIQSKTNKMQHTTKHNITCNSSNVIYGIECIKCQAQYVGQTKRKLKERIREHIYHVQKSTNISDVSYHFNHNEHCGMKDMRVYILDFIYAHPDSKRAKSLRNTIEFNWIQKLQTQSPLGLNTLDNRYG